MRTIQLPVSFEPKRAKRSYREISVSLMAGLANADGFLLPAELEAYTKAASAMLGRSMEQAQVRAAILDAFVNPPDPGVTIQDLKSVIHEDGVSSEGQLAVIQHLLQLVEGHQQTDLSGVRLVRSIIEGLGVPIGVFGQRLDTIQSKLPASLATGENTTQETTQTQGAVRRALNSISSLWRTPAHSVDKAVQRPVMLLTSRGVSNESSADLCHRMLKLGQTIASASLVGKAEELLNQLEPQGCRIALVGEMKHGKSSLFNLLLGTDLSPTGEATATTSAVVEMHWSEQPNYQGKWLSTEALGAIRKYVSANAENKRVADYGYLLEATVTAADYSPGGAIAGLDSLSAMADYVTAKGEHACAVERVRIGLPLSVLKSGAVIIDSPGLNDPMRVRDHITLEEAKKADCVCFVMRADKLGTESERKFLLSLLNEGRALALLVVVTHIDRLSSPAEVERVIDAAEKWVAEISYEAHVPRSAAMARVFGFCTQRGSAAQNAPVASRRGFEAFQTELARVAADPLRGASYAQWTKERQSALAQLGNQESEAFHSRLLVKLPDDSTLKALGSAADQFTQLAASYRKQIQQRLVSIQERIELEQKHITQDLDSLSVALSVELRSEIERLTRQLGDEYHREEHWKQFNQQTSANLLRSRFMEFEARNGEKMQLWERELRRFSEELELQIANSMIQLSTARRDFADVCSTSHFLATVSSGVDRTVSTARTASIVFAGAYATVGLTVGATGISWGFFTSIASIATGGGAVPVIAAVAVAGMIAHKLFSNPEKRKMKFIEAKVDACEEWLKARISPLKKQLSKDHADIWDRFIDVAEARYAPLVAEVLANAAEAKLRILVTERVKQDVARYLTTLRA